MVKKIKKLNLGTQRLLLILSFIAALLISYIINPIDFLDFDDEEFWFGYIFSWFIYWAIVFIVLWIIDGYSEKKGHSNA